MVDSSKKNADNPPSASSHNTPRCPWCGTDPLYQQYHDEEWGVPCFDERTLFEFLILEGAQAGLSWITILRKRENYRLAFDQFNPEIIASYDEPKVEELMSNAGIVRNQQKIRATINNARRYLTLIEQKNSLSDYLWDFVDGQPIVNQFDNFADIPAKTILSDVISKDMKQLGFKFFGSTICYAFMQATGMVNDHLTSCFRHSECQIRNGC